MLRDNWSIVVGVSLSVLTLALVIIALFLM